MSVPTPAAWGSSLVKAPASAPLLLTLSDADAIVPRASSVPQAWAASDPELVGSSFHIQPHFSFRASLRQAFLLLFLVVAASSLSALSGYVMFGHILHGPPGDAITVPNCTSVLARNATAAPSGEESPFRVVSMRTSVLKYWAIAVVCALFGHILLHDYVTTTIVAGANLGVALIATANLIEGWFIFKMIDQLVVALLLVMGFGTLILRTDPRKLDVANTFRFPRAAFYGSCCSAFISNNSTTGLSVEALTLQTIHS
eukprot:TRINITY_DN639_c0_g1_i2.p1 TRINITY_DN639_c0_g1~~TRINITY_DN639_c0_g1_i2.p1  ORF type:complete len:257 (+),score=2.24 TRINITY_DN639_c0_g1_i2:114-884(+)